MPATVFALKRADQATRNAMDEGLAPYGLTSAQLDILLYLVLKGFERPLPGNVRWCSGDYVGIEFVQRLPIVEIGLGRRIGRGEEAQRGRWWCRCRHGNVEGFGG